MMNVTNVWEQCKNEMKELREINWTLGDLCARHVNPITGLDVIWLDDYLQVPDGVSMLDFITQKYGKRAAEIIYKLATTTLKHD